MLFEAEARQKTSGMYIYYFSKGCWNIFGAARVFFDAHKEKARAPRTKLGTLTPAPGSAILFVGE